MTALTDSFPLRRTSVWGGVGANDVVPIRYGAVRGRCVPYTTGNLDIPPGLQWVWSDGACVGVDDVYVDGVQSVAWRAGNTADVTGAPIMMIEFSDPVDPTAVVSALGRGRIVGGIMARNPATVLNDLLSLAGFDQRDLAVFAAECDALGLAVDGEVSTDQTVQSVLRSVTASVGARFTSRARGTAIVHPGGLPVLVNTGPFIAARLGPTAVTSASAAIDDVANSITINFALRDGSPARVMVIDAPESIARFGRRSATVDMPWLAIDSVAERVGARLLRHSALPVYTVSAVGVRGDIRPGDWVSADPQVIVPFISGAYRVTASEHAPSSGLSDVQFQAFGADDIEVEVVSIAEIGADKLTLATGSGITVSANPPTQPATQPAPQQGGQPVQIAAQPGRVLRSQYFLSDGVFAPSQGLIDAGGTVEVFLVAGGASGSGAVTDPALLCGGGGGGGQVRTVIVEGVIAPTTVTIGAGGVAAPGDSVPGGNTSFGDAVALGGTSGVGGSGAVSGGGGGGAGGVGGDAAKTNTTAGTAGVFGGAGGFGTADTASSGGVGGIGIDGYGGGGGGGSVMGPANVGRGSSGGGDGGYESAGVDALANSGGGGGGGALIGDPPASSNGGNGGSGICVVRWWE